MSNATNEELLRRESVAASRPGNDGPEPAEPRSQQEAEATKQEASRTAESVKAQASGAAQAVSAEAGQAAAETRRAALDAGQRLRSEGVAVVSRQKNAAAEELAHFRDALHAAGEKLNEQQDQRVADLTHVAADRLDQAAEYLRDHDLNRLASDVAGSARRRPELFYGGLFFAGLAASRFFKASSRRHHHFD